MENKKIIWLASYPKSGNTWFRVFFTNLVMGYSEPADINNLTGGPISSSRDTFDDLAGTAASDLTMDEIDLARPDIYKHLADEFEEDKRFLKTHDAYTLLPDGRPMFPEEISHSAVYIIRNPFDVACSFAHHSNKPIHKSILDMNNENFAFCTNDGTLHNQLRQKLLSWSLHIRSWTEQDKIPVIILRYEDMKDDPVKEFTRALEFTDFDYTHGQISKAVGLSTFDKLKEMEKEHGFKEKNPKSESFFRKGKKGAWRNQLNDAMVESIIANHSEIMKKYGYLSENGDILV